MFSKTDRVRRGTAAWRLSLWSSLAFAVGTAVAFLFLQQFLVAEIQSRSDSWLTGELGVLADVAERTPANQYHDKVIREVAELASREVPRDASVKVGSMDRAVFFQQTTSDGTLQLHTGAASGEAAMQAIASSKVVPGDPSDVSIPGFDVPFRVAMSSLGNGDRIYLALSTEYERGVLFRLRVEFACLWLAIIALGTFIVYVSTGRMLRRVETITDTAETIGRSNLSSRVPTVDTNDEISRLSFTLNKMLDRVEVSVQQLHAMSDALAHDMRSPLTSLRGKLEFALLNGTDVEREIAIAQCIDEIDRLSALLDTSLDVSEASVDALRLRKESVDIDETLRLLVELYEPSFSQAGISFRVISPGPVAVEVDRRLMQRAMSNLLDNALKHLHPGTTVVASVEREHELVRLTIEDDGEGFSDDLLPVVFDRYTKGPRSPGFGLGLALVAAVIRSHEGTVAAENRPNGGSCIRLILPMVAQDAVRVEAAGFPSGNVGGERLS